MAFQDDDKITDFMVSIREIPKPGDFKILVRAQEEDRQLINDAATVLGMSTQKFAVAVLVSGAKKVLKEAGIS